MDNFEQELEQVAEVLEKAAKSGEGSRGGKIIGHTKSGKPIYDSHSHPGHADFNHSDHNDAIKAHHEHITNTKIGRAGLGNLHLMHEADDSKKLSPIKRAKIKASRESLKEHVHSYHQKKIADAETKDPGLSLSHKEQYNKYKYGAHKAEALESMSKDDKAKHDQLHSARHDAAEKRKNAAVEHGYNSPEHAEASKEHESSHAALLQHEEDVASRHPRSPKHEPTPYSEAEQGVAAKEKGDLEKMRERSANKPKIKGVHEAVMPSDPGTSNAGAHVPGSGYGSNVETAKRLHKDKLQEMRSMKKPNLTKGFETVLETVMELGPEGLRKALPSLTDAQKELLHEVLEKAKKMPEAAMGEEDGQELIELDSKKGKQPKRKAEEDEKLMDASIKDVRPQGDNSEKNGQVIKSEDTDEFVPVVARMKERGLEKSKCLEAAQAKGNEALIKAIEENWGEELEKAKKPMPPAQDVVPQPAVDGGKPPQDAPQVIVEVKKDSGEEDEEKQVAPEPVAEKKPQMIMKKSVKWSQGTQELLHASTRRGQNAHYTIEDSLLKSESEREEILSKGGYLNEAACNEELAKSKAAQRKVTVNDILEKGLDLGEKQLENLQLLANVKPSGAFNTKSFEESDLAKSLGFSDEMIEKVLGEDASKKKS